VEAISSRSDLHVMAVDVDAGKIRALRDRFEG
jgi:hypothetical protein